MFWLLAGEDGHGGVRCFGCWPARMVTVASDVLVAGRRGWSRWRQGLRVCAAGDLHGGLFFAKGFAATDFSNQSPLFFSAR